MKGVTRTYTRKKTGVVYKYWMVRAYDNGGQIYLGSFKNKQDAIDAIKRYWNEQR